MYLFDIQLIAFLLDENKHGLRIFDIGINREFGKIINQKSVFPCLNQKTEHTPLK